MHQSKSLGEGDQTLLHQAASAGKTDLIDSFVKSGADVNKKDGNGASPLACALKAGHTSAAAQLIGLGASIDDVEKEKVLTLFDNNPLVCAVLYDINALLRDTQNHDNDTIKCALTLAVSQGRPLSLQKLISRHPLSNDGYIACITLVNRLRDHATLTDLQRLNYQTVKDILMAHAHQRLRKSEPAPQTGISPDLALELLVKYGNGPFTRINGMFGAFP
jgi:ankyrin repeat protein